MGRTILQALNVLMLVLFGTAAVVQYNDPDPVLWIVVYGAGALCCLLYAANRLPVLLSSTVALICLLGTVYRLIEIFFGPIAFFDETGREMMGLVEETREMFGFLLTGAWVGVLSWLERRRSREPSVVE